jgi:hypothetical protein
MGVGGLDLSAATARVKNTTRTRVAAIVAIISNAYSRLPKCLPDCRRPRIPARIRGDAVNPIANRRDERSGHQLEGAMIIQSLGTAFILAFSAIAIFGHVLLVQAAFTARTARKAATADAGDSHRAELARARITA